MNSDLNFGQRLLPLFVDFVLENELNVGRVGFHRVYEQKWNFFRCESFFANDIVNDRFGLVVLNGGELVAGGRQFLNGE